MLVCQLLALPCALSAVVYSVLSYEWLVVNYHLVTASVTMSGISASSIAPIPNSQFFLAKILDWELGLDMDSVQSKELQFTSG